MEDHQDEQRDVADRTRPVPSTFEAEVQAGRLDSRQTDISSEVSDKPSSGTSRNSFKSSRVHKRNNSNKKVASCCSIRGSTADCEHCLVSNRLKQIYQVKPLSLGKVDLEPFEGQLLTKHAEADRLSIHLTSRISAALSASTVPLSELRVPLMSEETDLAPPPLQPVELGATTSSTLPFGRDRPSNA